MNLAKGRPRSRSLRRRSSASGRPASSDEGREAPSRHGYFSPWRLGLIVLATCLAYSNSLSGPFILDDTLAIVESPHVRTWRPLTNVLFPARELPTAGRPLVNVTFAFNYAASGLDVPGYHLANIALHLVCGLLVFGIVRRTLLLPSLAEALGRQSRNIAFAVALLWALHPLNTEAVDYVTQRTELLMALAYLLTLYAAIRAWPADRTARTPSPTSSPPSPASRWWPVAAVTSCAAGMACKESMVTAPLMVMLHDVVFVAPSFSRVFAERWRLYVGLAMSWTILAALLWSGPRVHSAGFGSGVSPWLYLTDQTMMITRYLRLVVWPIGLVVNYGPPFEVTAAEALPYVLFIATLLILTVVALARRPPVGFLGAWLFVTLAPTSSIVPIGTEVAAERRMYLPLVALLTLVVVAVATNRRLGATGKAVALILAVAALSAGTYARNAEYTSAEGLARTVVERYPTGVGHHWLATELLKAGKRDEGLLHLQEALPSAPRARYTLGVELFNEGDDEGAIEQLQTFVRDQPTLLEAVSARQLLGRALAQQRHWADAITQYRTVMTMNPQPVQRIETLGLLAEALYAAEDYEGAAQNYAAYVRSRPDDVEALNSLSVSLIALQRPDEAIAVLRRAVDLDPDHPGVRRNLANVLFDQHLANEAVVHARRAVALRPEDAAAHDILGRTLAVSGQVREARDEFTRALEIDPSYEDAREDLRRLQQGLSSP